MEPKSDDDKNLPKFEDIRGHLYTSPKLFHKVLTATDVSRNHSRFLIPKDGECHFREFNNRQVLRFLDMCDGIMWEFTYCIWPSNKFHVLTTGWNQFVKHKELKENEVINFYKCTEGLGEEDEDHYFMIEVPREETEGGYRELAEQGE